MGHGRVQWPPRQRCRVPSRACERVCLPWHAQPCVERPCCPVDMIILQIVGPTPGVGSPCLLCPACLPPCADTLPKGSQTFHWPQLLLCGPWTLHLSFLSEPDRCSVLFLKNLHNLVFHLAICHCHEGLKILFNKW